jgi:flagellin-specific chaperone FliS
VACDTWAEYLPAATEHLRATRLAIELGTPSPEPPAPPAGPVPDGLQAKVRQLVVGYDQLALEVDTRMTDMESTAGPELLVGLFDRLAADIESAGHALESDEPWITDERLRDARQHAQRIARVQRSSQPAAGSEAEPNLTDRYDLLLSELAEAHLTRDPSRIRRCREIVGPLREVVQRAVAEAEDHHGRR